MPSRVGVVGASARAAVHSLARAGRAAWACDLFADRDLTRVAPCVVCPLDSYPDAIPALAEQFPPGPILYTGGLENHPRVVTELAATRELWGNAPDVLERVRDPIQLRTALSGMPTPMLVPSGEPCPGKGRWLRKPLRSSAGHGIRFAQPGEESSPSHYFQEFIEGTPMSAVYFDDKLFGVTEQLIGEPWLHARPFAYCGNCAFREPLLLGSAKASTSQTAGTTLHGTFGLRGVWNIDLIARDGVFYPLEVNPRYSASVEVLEHATGVSVFQPGHRATGPPYIGKAIYYAPYAIDFPASGPWDDDLSGDFDPWRLPRFADIPAPGSIIEASWPVLTIFAAGSSHTECKERLQSRAAELDQLFAGATA